MKGVNLRKGKIEYDGEGETELGFGKCKGMKIRQCTSSYLISLVEKTSRDLKWSKPWDEGKGFKIPNEIEEEMRIILKKRGWKKQGERWTKQNVIMSVKKIEKEREKEKGKE